jgi:CAAX prenyl protease-like protein
MPPADTSPRSIPAYILPFLCYVLPTSFEASAPLGLGYEAVYTLKMALTAAALWYFRHSYPPFSSVGFGVATLAGIMGLVLWIGLADLQTRLPELQRWIESVQGKRAAYPFAGGKPGFAASAFIAIRLIGLAVVVPVMEEIFWRGFLARYLILDNFRQVPQGKFTPFSFVIVTVAFASVHPEVLAAIVWCALVNVVYMRTANLWACIVTHAVTNGLLGTYVLATGNWQLW